MQDIEHITSQRDQPGTPYKEFQKIHDNQAELDIHQSVFFMIK
jgi:hypothetical protein